MHTPRQGIIFTISGPSGTGKDTIARHLIHTMGNMKFVVTATTRKPRSGEENGVNYHFLTQETFLEEVRQGGFVEWISNNYGNYYGTLKRVIEADTAAGTDLISDITIHGVHAMQACYPSQTVSILVLPPSVEVLEQRLFQRQKTSGEETAQLELRLELIRERLRADLQHLNEPGYKLQIPDVEGATLNDFHYILKNDDLAATLKAAENIVAQERHNRRQVVAK